MLCKFQNGLKLFDDFTCQMSHRTTLVHTSALPCATCKINSHADTKKQAAFDFWNYLDPN